MHDARVLMIMIDVDVDVMTHAQLQKHRKHSQILI